MAVRFGWSDRRAAPNIDLMSPFVYRAGMAIGAAETETDAYLLAFGRNLKIERARRGLSQAEFGELIGMHRTFVGHLERGQCGVNVVELPVIARALGMRQADLLPEPLQATGPESERRTPAVASAASRRPQLHG
jgi:DNA-binding XRE family transcriptional regulator